MYKYYSRHEFYKLNENNPILLHFYGTVTNDEGEEEERAESITFYDLIDMGIPADEWGDDLDFVGVEIFESPKKKLIF
jgi:hypothetical protein